MYIINIARRLNWQSGFKITTQLYEGLQCAHCKYDKGILNVKECKRIYHANINQKKTLVTVLMLHEETSEPRKVLQTQVGFILGKEQFIEEHGNSKQVSTRQNT